MLLGVFVLILRQTNIYVFLSIIISTSRKEIEKEIVVVLAVW